MKIRELKKLLKSTNLEDQVLAVRMGFETLGEKRMRKLLCGIEDFRGHYSNVGEHKIRYEERDQVAEIYIKNTNVFIGPTYIALYRRKYPYFRTDCKMYIF